MFMSRKIVADLHSHTAASDGELSPTQLVDLAADAGLEVLAVTDHDTSGGVDEAIRHGRTRGLEVIPGCELTIYEGSIERHLLALFIDHHAPAFAGLMRTMQERRRERAMQMVKKIQAAGFAFEEQDVLSVAGNAESIGKPHVATALLRRGHVGTVQEAHKKFLGRNGIANVPKLKLTLDEAVVAVHGAGGLAMLAHPASEPHDELLASFFSRGMDGLEAIYPTHSDVNRRFYAGLARRYEKLITGGSDYHGPRVRAQTQIGMAGLDRDEFEALKRAVTKYRVNNS